MSRLGALAVLGVVACGGGGGTPGDDQAPDASPPDAGMGTARITGVVRYEDRAPQASGALAAPMPRPARGVALELITANGDTIAEAVSADDGTFELASVAVISFSDPVHILAATVSDAPGRRVDCVRPNNQVHGFGSPDFAPGTDVTFDVLVTESSGEAGAFNVFDQLIKAVDQVSALGLSPQSLTAIWARGNNDGTYYDGSALHLLGASSDDDGYDDTVILHESGHWAEDTIGRSDNPGGSHDGSPADPNLGWSEGFSTYWSMVVSGGPLYVDSNAAGGWSYNGDTEVTQMPAGGGPASDISEDTVTEILWDLGDAAADDDTFTGTHPAVIDVQPDYLRTTALRAIGEPGVDLWDFLDGFFITDGLAHCAQVRAITTTARRVPYDFAGPGGHCP